MKLLDKLYEKNHLTFAIVWIVAYVMIASTADGISLDLGTAKLVSVPVLAALTVLLWAWIRHAKLEGGSSSSASLWFPQRACSSTCRSPSSRPRRSGSA